MSCSSSQPDVSVVMPFHNAERWIGAAVQSLSGNAELRMELIAIDDASTDKSASIVENVGGLPVQVVRNDQKLGTTKSLNRGLAMARGEFIARMDADDISLPRRFTQQIRHIRQTSCDLCGTWIEEFGRGIPRRLTYPSGEDAVLAALLFQNPVCHPTILARREVFLDFQYNEEFQVAQDYDLLSRVSAKFRVDNVPMVLLRYRRHGGQTTLAKRELVASMASRIRTDTLRRCGIEVTPSELRLHNLIRTPRSIRLVEDLLGIESWLLRLSGVYPSVSARRVIATQWVYACVRAAALGKEMWKAYIKSPLHRMAHPKRATDLNVFLLSRLALSYESTLFDRLARFRAGT